MCEASDLAVLVKNLNVRGWGSEFEVATNAEWGGVEPFPGLPKISLERTKRLFSSTDKRSVGATSNFELFLRTATRTGLVPKPRSRTVAPLRSTLRSGQILYNDEDFVRLLENGVEDAHFILLCALLPNLGRLAVSGLSKYPTLDWYTFLSRPENALKKLGILHVSCTQPQADETVLKTTMQVLDILSNLWYLMLGNMSVQEHRYTLESLPTTDLRKVLFKNCATHRGLHKKIFAGQKLESFTLMPNIKATQTINAGASFSETQRTETLGQSRQTIREMAISPTKRSEQLRIQEYTSLRSLEIPIFVLLTSLKESEDLDKEVARCLLRCLPRSLRSIDLRCCRLEDMTEIAVLQMAHSKFRVVFPILSISR